MLHIHLCTLSRNMPCFLFLLLRSHCPETASLITDHFCSRRLIDGNILSCPSHCGTNLRTSMMLKINGVQSTFYKLVAPKGLHHVRKMTASAIFLMLTGWKKIQC